MRAFSAFSRALLFAGLTAAAFRFFSPGSTLGMILVFAVPFLFLWDLMYLSNLRGRPTCSDSLPLGTYRVLAYSMRPIDRSSVVILDRQLEPGEYDYLNPETICVWISTRHDVQRVLERVGSLVQLVRTTNGKDFLLAEGEPSPVVATPQPAQNLAAPSPASKTPGISAYGG